MRSIDLLIQQFEIPMEIIELGLVMGYLLGYQLKEQELRKEQLPLTNEEFYEYAETYCSEQGWTPPR